MTYSSELPVSEAILLLIQSVDGNGNKWTNPETRALAFEELASLCSFAPKRRRSNTTDTPKSEYLKSVAASLVKHIAVGYQKRVETFWREGSKCIRPGYLKKIGYHASMVTSQAWSDLHAERIRDGLISSVPPSSIAELVKPLDEHELRGAEICLASKVPTVGILPAKEGDISSDLEGLRNAEKGRNNGVEANEIVRSHPIPSQDLAPAWSSFGDKVLPSEGFSPAEKAAYDDVEDTYVSPATMLGKNKRRSSHNQRVPLKESKAANNTCATLLNESNSEQSLPWHLETEHPSPPASMVLQHKSLKRKAPVSPAIQNCIQREPSPEPKRQAKDQRAQCVEAQQSPPSSSPLLLETSQPFADSTAFFLHEDALGLQMEGIYNVLVSVVYEEMSRGDRGVERPAIFALGPSCSTNLMRLYTLLLSKFHFLKARANMCNLVLGLDLAIALVGAFFHFEVFQGGQIETTQDLLSSIMDVLQEYYPKVEEHLGQLSTSLDTILRRAYSDRIQDMGFKVKLAPLATRLADDLADRLYDHLRAGSDGSGEYASRHSTIIRLSPFLAEVIQRALLLKCELSSAREEYRFSWFQYGEAFDEGLMESTHGAGSVVLATVFPGLVVEKNGVTRVVCRARVRLKTGSASN